MTTLQEIIASVRLTLADPNGSRWPDARLLQLANEGNLDITTKARLIIKDIIIPLAEGKASYSLPEDTINIVSAFLQGDSKVVCDLNLINIFDISKQVGADWRNRKGLPTHLVYNSRDRLQITTYPSYHLGDNDKTLTEPYGVISDIQDAEVVTKYGTVSDVLNEDTIQDSPYGLVTDITATQHSAVVTYIARPKLFTSFDDEILPQLDRALKYFIVASALRDDMDTRNRQISLEEHQFYLQELQQLQKDKASSFVDSGNQDIFETNYNTGF